MRHSARVPYTIDHLSPAALTLLRHASVVDDELGDAVTWQWSELPDGPLLRLPRTVEDEVR